MVMSTLITTLVAVLLISSHFSDVSAFSANSPSLGRKSFLPSPMPVQRRVLRPGGSGSGLKSPQCPRFTVRVARNVAAGNSASGEGAQVIIGTDTSGYVSQAKNSAEALSEIWNLISSGTQAKRGDQDAGHLLEFPSLHEQQVQAIVSHVQHCQSSRALGLDSFVIHSGGLQQKSVLIRSIPSQNAQLEIDSTKLVDDDTVISQTRSWMTFMIAPKSGLGLCPFTATFNRGGRPAAPIHYAVAGAGSVGSASSTYAALWAEASALLSLPDTARATTLLLSSSPLWYRGPADPTGAAWACKMCNMLTLVPDADAGTAHNRFLQLVRTIVSGRQLQRLGLSQDLHLVSFHPQFWQQPGRAPASAHYSRRSPFPILNWVRGAQLDEAQEALGSGYVFAAQNEQCLAALGPEEWQRMLAQGQWQLPRGRALSSMRVDRRNPHFSLFFPSFFARDWARNPAESVPAMLTAAVNGAKAAAAAWAAKQFR